MANHKSAVKRHRQSLDNRNRNRQHKSRMRSRVKQLRTAIDKGDGEAARGMLDEILALVDKSTKLGVLHRNAAARTKSRLTRAVNRTEAGS
jgi:small subunit ribosomal protein S20